MLGVLGSGFCGEYSEWNNMNGIELIEHAHCERKWSEIRKGDSRNMMKQGQRLAPKFHNGDVIPTPVSIYSLAVLRVLYFWWFRRHLTDVTPTKSSCTLKTTSCNTPLFQMLYVSRIALLSYFVKFTANLFWSHSVWTYAASECMPSYFT